MTMRDLVRNCLRMRPERIIVGEVRGPEAFDLLMAMNTGHDGSMGTVHANSPREALSRLESLITLGGYNLPSKTASRNDLHVDRCGHPGRASARRFAANHASISEVVGTEGDVIITQDLLTYQIDGEDEGRPHQGQAMSAQASCARRSGIAHAISTSSASLQMRSTEFSPEAIETKWRSSLVT